MSSLRRNTTVFRTLGGAGNAVRIASSAAPGGIVRRAEEMERDVRLVPDHPAVVSGRDREHISRLRDELGSVGHPHAGPTRDHDPTCSVSQSAVPAIGPKCSDHFQPGS
jgi:hypothetical protein